MAPVLAAEGSEAGPDGLDAIAADGPARARPGLGDRVVGALAGYLAAAGLVR